MKFPSKDKFTPTTDPLSYTNSMSLLHGTSSPRPYPIMGLNASECKLKRIGLSAAVADRQASIVTA